MTDPVFQERLTARLKEAGLFLAASSARQFERYYALLARWNAKINLTSLPLENYPASTLDRLFVEPLLAAELVQDRRDVWFDLGAGGGSPAIPLKIVRPRLSLTMVEATTKKTAFLREACHEVGLEGVKVLTARFESLSSSVEAGSVDLITARAVRFDAVLRRTALELLKPGGRLIYFGLTAELPAGFRRAPSHRSEGLLTVFVKE